MNSFEASILRVMKNDIVVGAAFLASERLIVTCAHAIKSAGKKAGETVRLRFSDEVEIDGLILPEYWRDGDTEDIAILQLEKPLIDKKPLLLGTSIGAQGHTFLTLGFPSPRQELTGRGEIVGEAALDGAKFLQLDSNQVTLGFSGAPVIDEETKYVVGMIVSIIPPDNYQRLGTTAFAIPCETLQDVCPELQLNPEKLRASPNNLLMDFVEWSLNRNAFFSIPNLNLSLPISQTWARLMAINSKEKAEAPVELTELTKHINNYREWYELARDRQSFDSFDIERIAHQNRFLVVIGGPGAGKSTLLRRLAWELSQDGHIVLRISLRAVALRVKNGESFDEAVLATALDGFSGKGSQHSNLLNDCNYLLADGLDEAGEERLAIADYLQQWASSHPSYKVVITTRPIEYNPSWLADWPHFELLPLKEENINSFILSIFGLMHPDNIELNETKK